VQFATARDPKHIGIGRLFYAQRHVALQLAHQAITNLTAGDELAFATGEWRRVDLESHRERGLIDLDRWQPIGRFDIAQRDADVHLFDTRDGDDVARDRFIDRHALEATET